jgi:hypothetical protein
LGALKHVAKPEDLLLDGKMYQAMGNDLGMGPFVNQVTASVDLSNVLLIWHRYVYT